MRDPWRAIFESEKRLLKDLDVQNVRRKRVKNEKTGKKAGSAAGALLANCEGIPDTHHVIAVGGNVQLGLMEFLASLGLGSGNVRYLGNVKGLKAVAGSSLTQRPDRKAGTAAAKQKK